MGNGFVVIADRGGHLHNARMLLTQLGRTPDALLTTTGPELSGLRRERFPVHRIPYLFSWVGKRRLWNPLKSAWAVLCAAWWVGRLRPRCVISLGASDVVPFCYLARMVGAKIFHVECMNQVSTPSVTGRLLYPVCEAVYVQWPELLRSFGNRARYSGWVLG